MILLHVFCEPFHKRAEFFEVENADLDCDGIGSHYSNSNRSGSAGWIAINCRFALIFRRYTFHAFTAIFMRVSIE